MRNRLALVLASVALAGCGDSGSSGPSGPTKTSVLQVPFSLARFSSARFDFVLPGSGNETGSLEISVDWTLASNNVDLYFAAGSCVGLNVVGICSGQPCCPILATAESRTAKPETLTTSQPPGRYSLFVGNLGPGSESGTASVNYTR